jgi:spore maturation protein CgeB
MENSKTKLLIVSPIHSWSSMTVYKGLCTALQELKIDFISHRLDRSFHQYRGSAISAISSSDAIINIDNLAERSAMNDSMAEIFSIVLDIKPEILLVIHGGNFGYSILDTIRELKKCGYLNTISGVWLLDDPHEIDISSQYSKRFDFVFDYERSCIRQHQDGDKIVEHIPVAADSISIEEFKNDNPSFKSDISIVGVGFKERLEFLSNQLLVDYIIKNNIALSLYGLGWMPLLQVYQNKIRIVNRIIPQSMTYEIYYNSVTTINFFRDTQMSSLGYTNRNSISAYSLNPRCYEALVCGTKLITDYRNDIDIIKHPNLYTYNRNNIDSFINVIKIALSTKLRLIVPVPKNLTYIDRAEKILEIFRNKLHIDI